MQIIKIKSTHIYTVIFFKIFSIVLSNVCVGTFDIYLLMSFLNHLLACVHYAHLMCMWAHILNYENF